MSIAWSKSKSFMRTEIELFWLVKYSWAMLIEKVLASNPHFLNHAISDLMFQLMLQ